MTEEHLTAFDPSFFGDPEIVTYESTVVPRLPSTDDTRERYAFLKTKRLGTTWQEGDFLYRMGPSGVTVFDALRWGA